MATDPVTRFTEGQYLDIERAAEFRSEFLDGEIFAMFGGSMAHSGLQRNLLWQLHPALQGSPCDVFGSHLRVKVSSRMYTYPDVTVLCGTPLVADRYEDSVLNPAVIFEVLSPSTERLDRGLKFQRYRTIPSLRDYILVAQDEAHVEQFSRQPDNTWTLRDYQGIEAELKIDFIGVSIGLRQIYDRIELAGESVAAALPNRDR